MLEAKLNEAGTLKKLLDGELLHASFAQLDQFLNVFPFIHSDKRASHGREL
jgi:hypothetical protein